VLLVFAVRYIFQLGLNLSKNKFFGSFEKFSSFQTYDKLYKKEAFRFLNMICIIALVVFSIMGIFSATHREIAKEALDCVLRRVTLRKCETGLDKRLKAQITGKLMRRYPRLGKRLYKHFELVTWVFLILFFVSIFYSGQGLYFFAKYGNCNGPNSDAFCIFDPLNTMGGHQDPDVCVIPGAETDNLLELVGDISGHPFIGSEDLAVTVVEFGCFSCPNTKNAVPAVKKVLEEYEDRIHFVYIDFPLRHHDYAWESSVAAHCVWIEAPELYWDYHFKLFENQEELSEESLKSFALELGVEEERFDECIDGSEGEAMTQEDFQTGTDSNVYGTPTFFINGQPLVGAVPFKDFKELIDEELER
jgi:thiol-disulfide isomerase/thioredoxin